MTAELPVSGTGEATDRYLHDRLAILAARVAEAVARRRADDPDPSDRFRGLYISDVQVDGLLSGRPAAIFEPALDATTAGAAAELEAFERRTIVPMFPSPSELNGRAQVQIPCQTDRRANDSATTAIGRARDGGAGSCRETLRAPIAARAA